MFCRKLTDLLRFSVSGIFIMLLIQCGLSSGKGVPTTQSNTLSYDNSSYVLSCLPELSGVATELDLGKDVDVCPEGKYFSHQFCLECPSGQ